MKDSVAFRVVCGGKSAQECEENFHQWIAYVDSSVGLEEYKASLQTLLEKKLPFFTQSIKKEYEACRKAAEAAAFFGGIGNMTNITLTDSYEDSVKAWQGAATTLKELRDTLAPHMVDLTSFKEQNITLKKLLHQTVYTNATYGALPDMLHKVVDVLEEDSSTHKYVKTHWMAPRYVALFRTFLMAFGKLPFSTKGFDWTGMDIVCAARRIWRSLKQRYGKQCVKTTMSTQGSLMYRDDSLRTQVKVKVAQSKVTAGFMDFLTKHAPLAPTEASEKGSADSNAKKDETATDIANTLSAPLFWGWPMEGVSVNDPLIPVYRMWFAYLEKGHPEHTGEDHTTPESSAKMNALIEFLTFSKGGHHAAAKVMSVPYDKFAEKTYSPLAAQPELEDGTALDKWTPGLAGTTFKTPKPARRSRRTTGNKSSSQYTLVIPTPEPAQGTLLRREAYLLALRKLRDMYLAPDGASSRTDPDVIPIFSVLTDLLKRAMKAPAKVSKEHLNMLLMGPAGSGKTTMAKLVANVLSASGILLRHGIEEVTRADLVGQYLGQTAPRVRAALARGIEKVLFLDEAYGLAMGDSYSDEAITEIVRVLDEYRGHICMIGAGYEPEMREHFLGSNEGMPRRFPLQFVLPSKTPQTMVKVLKKMVGGPKLPTGMLVKLITLDKETSVVYKSDPTRACTEKGKCQRRLFEFQLGDILTLSSVLQSFLITRDNPSSVSVKNMKEVLEQYAYMSDRLTRWHTLEQKL